ncbi:type I-E CRISPR-associated protein Cas6/Cse3/CasE [Thiorhodococcus mannitoliphagus]|uniref:Type I-E CRISPR-associated protein Cas6/Cse3/CasE n=1 Tax=Thiorhodococcus mannitoliphagus TaxID=329406 RepID=A0A6P1DXI7_9GAMM|nr:type I-E CRISPR-associated protein Cas6/Cse3/CasE [Thiorhodococcus mannitoliphagus]
MYLSRLTLDPRHPRVRRDLGNRYEMHRTLARAFAPDETSAPYRFLWRLESSAFDAGSAVLLVQSEMSADWKPLEGDAGYALEILGNKPVDLEQLIQASARYRFRLQANPTVTRNGKRYGLVKEDAQLDWLDRQALKQGFTVLGAIRADCERLQARQPSTRRRITLQSALYEGHLEATDPGRLRQAIMTGLGHGKAWGLGLLSVARST